MIYNYIITVKIYLNKGKKDQTIWLIDEVIDKQPEPSAPTPDPAQ